MSKLPQLNSRKIISVLKKMDFVLIRQKGSHAFFKHRDGRTTVVPIHSRTTIGKGLLQAILEDINLTKNELHKYL